MHRIGSAHLLAFIALIFSLTGSAYAVSQVTGATVKDGSLTSADIRNGSLVSKDVKNGSITSADLAADAKAATSGPQGPAGPAGPEGPAGASTPSPSFTVAPVLSVSTVPAHNSDSMTVYCPEGQVAVGGAWNRTDATKSEGAAILKRSIPGPAIDGKGTSWRFAFENVTDAASTVEVQALCLTATNATVAFK